MDDEAGVADRPQFGRLELLLDELVVRRELGELAEARPALLGQGVDAAAHHVKGTVRDLFPHVVKGPDRPRAVRHVEKRPRCRAHHGPLFQDSGHLAHGVDGKFDVGVQVEPREVPGGPVAGIQRRHLGRHGDLHHGGKRGRPASHLRRLVAAPVAHHHHVELALLGPGEQGGQAAPDHRLLVVRRDHDRHRHCASARLGHQSSPERWLPGERAKCPYRGLSTHWPSPRRAGPALIEAPSG